MSAQMWYNFLCSKRVSDLFNQKYPFIQPYDGFEAPIPAQGREFFCKLRYSFKIKR